MRRVHQLTFMQLLLYACTALAGCMQCQAAFAKALSNHKEMGPRQGTSPSNSPERSSSWGWSPGLTTALHCLTGADQQASCGPMARPKESAPAPASRMTLPPWAQAWGPAPTLSGPVSTLPSPPASTPRRNLGTSDPQYSSERGLFIPFFSLPCAQRETGSQNSGGTCCQLEAGPTNLFHTCAQPA